MNGKSPPNLPLSGITVVSLEQAIAAPLASRHLADWGARVIKIERPGKGDFCRDYDYVMNGMSSQFAWTNRSKESLALDVKSSEGKRVLDALLPQADVFLQNLAPGAAKRLGLDAATLVARFPRLIACDISGYGSGGPYSEKKAYDLLVQCETGFPLGQRHRGAAGQMRHRRRRHLDRHVRRQWRADGAVQSRAYRQGHGVRGFAV